MSKEVIHLKGLNGIRAIAALSVVLSHTLIRLGDFGMDKVEGGWDFASYGVTMFFTLSGFLITYLLLIEKKTTDNIVIRDFYIRRVLRIWPLYYFYILLALIAIAVAIPATGLSNIYYYLFMAGNVSFALGLSIPLLEHFWSLGVEEQFYLFWPALVKWFSPLKSITIFLGCFFALKIILRVTMPESIAYKLVGITRFDCMAIGALSAILVYQNHVKFVKLCLNKLTQIVAWLIWILAAMGKLKVPDLINQDIFCVASAIIILNTAFNIRPLVNLENKVLNFLGRISYGIYVYHVLVIFLLGLLIKDQLGDFNYYAKVIFIVAVVGLVTILLAWVSYEFLEKPFLKYKNRFSKILSKA